MTQPRARLQPHPWSHFDGRIRIVYCCQQRELYGGKLLAEEARFLIRKEGWKTMILGEQPG